MTFPLRRVIDFAMNRPFEIDRAYGEFFGKLSFPKLEKQWEELFSEWLIFDFATTNKTSFLVEYFLKNPDNFDEKHLHQFDQIIKTQFYSQFEILEIKRGLWIRVEDLFTGKIYTIHEKKGSETAQGKGIIPGRIAKVDGKWFLVGANSVYFPIAYTQRAKKNMRDLKVKNYSPKDTVELLRSQKQSPPMPISVPTIKELEAKRKNLEKDYKQMAKKYGTTLMFGNLIKLILEEKRVNILDFWMSLEKKGLKLRMLMNCNKLIEDIWNYFPHKCLGNKSPIEVFAELKEAERSDF